MYIITVIKKKICRNKIIIEGFIVQEKGGKILYLKNKGDS